MCVSYTFGVCELYPRGLGTILPGAWKYARDMGIIRWGSWTIRPGLGNHRAREVLEYSTGICEL